MMAMGQNSRAARQDGRPYGSAAASALERGPVADLGRSVGLTVLATLAGLLLILLV